METQRAYSGFLMSLGVTIGLGILLSRKDHLGLETVFMFVILAAGLIGQAVFSGRHGMDKRQKVGSEAVEGSQEKEGSFYCGVWLDANESPDPGALSPALASDRMMQRLALGGALLGAYALCLRFFPAMTFRPAQMPELVSVLVILFASSLGHFLFALGLSILTVIPAQLADPSGVALTHWILPSIYTLSVFFTLHVQRLLEFEINDSDANFFARDGKAAEILWSSARALALFVALTVCIDRLLPGKVVQPPPPHARVVEVGFGHEIPLPKHVSSPSLSNAPAPDNPVQLSPDTLAALTQAMKLPGMSSGMSPESIAQMNSLIRSIRSNQAPDDLPPGYSSLDPDKASQLLQSLQADLAKQKSMAKPEEIAELKQLEDLLQKALETRSRSQNPASLSQSTIDQLQEVAVAMAKAPTGNIRGGSTSDLPTPPAHTQPIITPTLEKLAPIGKHLLVGLAFFMIFIFLTRLFRQNFRPEDLNQKAATEMTADEKTRLRQEWKTLDREKLSAREEVIRKYHFFLQVMKAAGHARPESLPPSEFAFEVRRSFPWIDSPVCSLTDTFCDAYYGPEEPSSTRLREFRKHVERVRAQFI